MDLRLSHWISHKYPLLTLSLIDSSWNCLTQIISKLSSIVSRSSVSVYQVWLWLVAPKTFQAKIDSVWIFLPKDSCVCKLLYFVILPRDWAGCGLPSPLLDVPNLTAHPSTASVPTSCASLFVYRIACAFGLLCSIVCLLVKLHILFNYLI